MRKTRRPTIRDVLERSDLVAVIAARTEVVRKGSRFAARCPFHDDRHPSLWIWPEAQRWWCFVCGFGGTALDFVVRHDRVGVHEAVETLLGATPARPRRIRETMHVHRKTLTDEEAQRRDEAYRALLASEGLAHRDIEHLLGRGFRLEDVISLEYRSHAPKPVRWDAEDVPGFFRGEDGGFRVAGPRGILLPVRDAEGRIVACQIRCRNPSLPKYVWLSSSGRPGGASPGAPCHVSRPEEVDSTHVWVTEGPLKADALALSFRVTAVAVPGVGALADLEPTLRRLAPKTVTVAFDEDRKPASRAAVARASAYVVQVARRAGARAVFTAEWPDVKGVDDAFHTSVPVVIRRI